MTKKSTSKKNKKVILETEYFDLETDTNSLKEFDTMCEKLNVSLDYLIFEFI